jgi:acetyl-CoA C-acetyltransferase
MIHPDTPVLIGGGQFTHRGDPVACPTPIEMCAIAARAAAADAGLGEDALRQADFVAVVGFTIDSSGVAARLSPPRAANPPKALAKALGAKPRATTYTHTGGNTPQALVNHAARLIGQGEARFVVLAGAEFLGSFMKLVKAGRMDVLAVHDLPDEEAPPMFGDGRADCTPHEAAHGLNIPANVYPLFEVGLRAHEGLSVEAHRARMGALFAPFTRVAARNPHAWFPVERTTEELVTVTPDNRMVGHPYPKRLNAIIQVDQSAAIIMTSHAKARELGVADENMVFLHGCSDTTELWNPLDRVDYHSSPAIRAGARAAFDMAGKTVADMDFFDLYSCFPIAVRLACREMGLAEDDPRGLTLTGGLPYFGGPGNNYTMHAIAETIARCRKAPGRFGFVNANGWYLTKHAMGIYSTTPTQGPWRRPDQTAVQAGIDALAHPAVTETPEGRATIETCTVIHAREGRRMGIVIGRDGQGRRFVANTPKGDEAMMAALETGERVGATGHVTHADGRNVFTLAE